MATRASRPCAARGRRAALAGLALAAACASAPPPRAAPGADGPTRAARVAIARAEAARGAGLPQLLRWATRGTLAERALALRGLGRVGGAQALAALRAALADPRPAIVAAAATALGVAAALDEWSPGDAAAATAALRAALAVAAGPGAPAGAILEALGRAGEASAQPELAAQLAGPPALAAAAAIALGRHGRRKLSLDPAARAALARAAAHPDARVRAAAVWALGREHLAEPPTPGAPDPAPEVTASLRARAADPEPEIRAHALAALARRRPGDDVGAAPALADADRRVVVEAMRALTAAGAPATAQLTAARAIAARVTGLAGALAARRAAAGAPSGAGLDVRSADARPSPAAAAQDLAGRVPLDVRAADVQRWQLHAVLEGLRGLAATGAVGAPGSPDAEVARELATIADQVASPPPIAERAADRAASEESLGRGWIECLARVAHARRTPSPPPPALARCGGAAFPEHLRLPLLAQLVEAQRGTLAERRAAVAALLGHADPRVRAAGAAAIPALWAGAGPDRSADARALAAALASADAAVAGAAVEAAAAIYRAVATPGAAALAGGASEPAADAAALAVLDAAIVARATSEVDVELAAGLYEAIAARRIAAGLAACQAALAGPAAAAAAARACVIALGRPAPPPRSDPAAAVAPPVDVASVIGHRVRWRLATTRGPIAIDLDPQSAPWAVAAIAALTRRGFYDGLEVHRVVPGFVVQGGDPTQSGWGGPGFSLPAEPGAAAGAAFTAGGVGIADAGRDSGGSQWFIMHASAPHLDGRYTWIGAISAGQAHADALLVGDRVLRATIEIAP